MRLVVGAVIGVVAAFVILQVLWLGGDVGGGPAIERPALLGVGLLLFGLASFVAAVLWRSIVLRLDTARPALVDSIAVFCASWLGRYVPTSLPYLAGKLLLGARLGHAPRALATSVVYENALIVAMAAASSAVVIPIMLAGEAGGPLLFAAAGLGGAVGILVLSPPVFHRLLNAAISVAHRQPIQREHVLSYSGVAVCSSLALANLVINGAGFALILNGFVGLDARELIAAAAIFNLAGAAGVAALPVPSGIGVREAVLIGLLQVFVPLEVAAAAAVVARLIMIGIDLSFGLAGGALIALRRPVPSTQDAPSTQIEQQRQLDAA